VQLEEAMAYCVVARSACRTRPIWVSAAIALVRWQVRAIGRYCRDALAMRCRDSPVFVSSEPTQRV